MSKGRTIKRLNDAEEITIVSAIEIDGKLYRYVQNDLGNEWYDNNDDIVDSDSDLYQELHRYLGLLQEGQEVVE